MSEWSWSKEQLSVALEELKLQKGDLVFLHSNLGFSGVCREKNPSAIVIEEILEKIGKNGALFVPAFSYAFPQGRAFDPAEFPQSSGMGSVSAYAYSLGFKMSKDPIFGVLGQGESVLKIFESQTNRSFGPGSLFSILLDLNVKMLSINVGAGGTILHEMEFRNAVPYRFEKTFKGKVADRSKNIQTDLIWISYVRDLSNPLTEARFENLTELLYLEGIWKKSSLGKGYISIASSIEVFEFVSRYIKLDPAFLIKLGTL
jgi:aminoglycoside 3-N-acetyltransferase